MKSILTDDFAEHDLLALAIVDGALDPAGIVDPEDFASRSRAEVWAAMLAIAARKGRIDLVTVRDELEQAGSRVTQEFLVDLTETIPASCAGVIAERVRHLARARRRRPKLLKAVAELEAGRVGESDALILALAEDGFSTGTVEIRSAATAVEAVIHRLMARANGKASDLVPLGLGPVDKVIGGLSPSSLTVIAGDTGVGKSTTALHAICETEQSTGPVGYVSCEDPEDVMGGKLLAAESGIAPDVFRTSDLTAAQWEKTTDAAGKVYKREIHFAYPIGGTVADVCSAMTRLVRQKGARLVVVDYLQTINIGGRVESRREAVRLIVSRIKATAAALGIPVVLLSQFKRRDKPTERPTKWDLKESGDIENMAEAIILLWKDANGDVKGVLDKSKWTASGRPFLMKRGEDGLLRAAEIDNGGSGYGSDYGSGYGGGGWDE